MAEQSGTRIWRGFWDHGTWWKAVLLVVVYWGLYQLIGLGLSAVFHGFIDAEDPLATPSSVFFGVALPILVMGLLLTVLAWSLGWLPQLFRRQTEPRPRWMWIAVVLVVVPIVLRLVGTNWSAYSAGLVLTILFLGLCVGLAEELLTRGYVIRLLRSAGHGERGVMVLSSALFALLHAGNVVSGQDPLAVAFTVVYTFGFGAMMYLVLRVTGSLIWPLLLHAATDPTTILATGGIDAHGAAGGDQGLVAVAGQFNVVYILFAIVAIFLVRSRRASNDD